MLRWGRWKTRKSITCSQLSVKEDGECEWRPYVNIHASRELSLLFPFCLQCMQDSETNELKHTMGYTGTDSMVTAHISLIYPSLPISSRVRYSNESHSTLKSEHPCLDAITGRDYVRGSLSRDDMKDVKRVSGKKILLVAYHMYILIVGHLRAVWSCGSRNGIFSTHNF